MANRYNDQDYPRYYERDDRYDSSTEFNNRDRNRRPRNERQQRNDNSDNYENRNLYNSNDDVNFSNRHQGFAGGSFGSDFGRGYSSTDRDNQDFTNQSSPRRGFYGETNRENRNGGNERNQQNNRNDQNSRYERNEGDDYTLYYKKDKNEDKGEQRYSSGSHNYQPQNRDASDNQGGGYSQQRNRNYDQEQRGWWDRTSDELASWFGDDDATRRRTQDEKSQNYSDYEKTHRGRGPKNYKRSDDRIKEDLNDRLTDYAYLDASDIDVEVNAGEVTLTGTVESRYAKRVAEDIADNISGVNHVENRLRVANQKNQTSQNHPNTATTENTGTGNYSTGSAGTTQKTENTGNTTAMSDAIKSTDTTTLGLTADDPGSDKSKSNNA